MRLLVISDTHGKTRRVDEVVSRCAGFDMLLFLGDGLKDFCGREHLGVFSVSGNCDGFFLGSMRASAPEERMIDAEGVKLLMMHGHRWGVKSSHTAAAAHAANMGADVLLFGHTHEPIEKYYPAGSELGGVVLIKPLYVFNPGSLGQPREGEPSFGVIEIKRGQILLSHGAV